MNLITGVLEYDGALLPGSVRVRNSLTGGISDVYAVVQYVCVHIQGKCVEMIADGESITIGEAEASDWVLARKNVLSGTRRVILRKQSSFGLIVLTEWLSLLFQSLAGRQVVCEWSREQVTFRPDQGEVVPMMRLTRSKVAPKITERVAKKLCGVRSSQRCVFLAMNDNGFSCSKFAPEGAVTLAELSQGKLCAHRVGTCGARHPLLLSAPLMS